MKATRILIVEDDFLVREWIRKLLEQAGFTIVGTAVNGRKALEQTEALRPSVILMDIGLPGDMDGIEAARQIGEVIPTPIVVLSAYESPEMLARATAAGVGAYVTKPTDERTLERAIIIAEARFKDLLALRQLNAELQAEIARRQRAEEIRTRMTQELMTLYETSLEINAQPNWPRLQQLITERLTQLVHARVGVLYLTQPDGLQALQHIVGAGDSHPALEPDHLLGRLANQAALSGRALLPDGFHHEGHFFPRVMCLPLQTGGKVIGVLVAADDQLPDPFSEHEFWLAGLFAEQVVIALENSQLREAVRSSPSPNPPSPVPGPGQG
jgi:AmiR/NasT family two-component response regulator